MSNIDLKPSDLGVGRIDHAEGVGPELIGECRTYTFNDVSITCERRGTDWMAYINGNKGVWSAGAIDYAAIGGAFVTGASLAGNIDNREPAQIGQKITFTLFGVQIAALRRPLDWIAYSTKVGSDRPYGFGCGKNMYTAMGDAFIVALTHQQIEEGKVQYEE